MSVHIVLGLIVVLKKNLVGDSGPFTLLYRVKGDHDHLDTFAYEVQMSDCISNLLYSLY